MGIKNKRCKDIIAEINSAVRNFSWFAEQVSIKEQTVAYINSVIAEHNISI